MKINKKKIIFLYLALSLCLITSPYKAIFAGDTDSLANVEEEIVGTFWQFYFNIFDFLSFLYPFIMIGSFCVSTILIIVFHKDKRIKKMATIIGFLTIPIIFTFLVYAMPYIYLASHGI